mmetsp:Transcript_1612/g.3698  ORF Transcript_1612/g.3698 Transcript_1612/m.3698 type:complete len:224 (+) Transcript_1612:2128-2799(+)
MDNPTPMRPPDDILQERNPPHISVGSLKNVLKNLLVVCTSRFIRISMPKHIKVRWRRSSCGQMLFHTRLDMLVALIFFSLSAPSTIWSSLMPSTIASTRTGAWKRLLATIYPVAGCTIPAVPPMPSTLCGSRGRTPPIGMRQYSSSSIERMWIPMPRRRCSSLSFSSSKGMNGRATRLVSSTKILFLENGMTYRKVGSFSLLLLSLSSRCSSRQSMNIIESRS